MKGDNNENDLSHCKVGDKIWTIREGWTDVIALGESDSYFIKTEENSYTRNGKLYREDKYPCAFLEPPAGFDVESEFVKGQRVLVSNCKEHGYFRMYFSHMDKGTYQCFINGSNEWSSNGCTRPWTYCRAWEEE